jgi:hypothetical protein
MQTQLAARKLGYPVARLSLITLLIYLFKEPFCIPLFPGCGLARPAAARRE